MRKSAPRAFFRQSTRKRLVKFVEFELTESFCESSKREQPEHIVDEQNIVVVNIQYRLGEYQWFGSGNFNNLLTISFIPALISGLLALQIVRIRTVICIYGSVQNISFSKW